MSAHSNQLRMCRSTSKPRWTASCSSVTHAPIQPPKCRAISAVNPSKAPHMAPYPAVSRAGVAEALTPQSEPSKAQAKRPMAWLVKVPPVRADSSANRCHTRLIW